VAAAFRPLAREAVAIPFAPSMVEGSLRYGSLRYGSLRYGSLRYGSLRYGSLRPETQRAWLRAAAAVARGL
jgi:hypothetical protein